ncbi:MAG: hypothetical protein GXY83_13345 [Rhodopirellula sp.]|nr:hypothetical protein [Rhodopirellula sp.]
MKTPHLALGVLALAAPGFALAFAGCGGSVQSTETKRADSPAVAVATADSQPAGGSSAAKAALEKAAKAEKYFFAFFWKADDENTVAMRKVFDEAMASAADRADAVAVKVTDAAEKEIVKEYGLERAPMPLVLAIAPNGAITGGFPAPFSQQDLSTGFATPGTQKCMKALQDGKLVFLCVQNAEMQASQDAMKGVRDFKADVRFASATEVVMLDPKDTAEASFLADLEIKPDASDAVTVFLAPPGSPIGKFEGATTKEQLAEMLMKASSGCGPGGCGPGGCGPR